MGRGPCADLAGEELEAARSFWRTLAPDEGAVYDRTVTIGRFERQADGHLGHKSRPVHGD